MKTERGHPREDKKSNTRVESGGVSDTEERVSFKAVIKSVWSLGVAQVKYMSSTHEASLAPYVRVHQKKASRLSSAPVVRALHGTNVT